MNRHQRRAQNAIRRGRIRSARLRCVSCERVGQTMTKEHFWPLWLVDYANVSRDGVAWEGGPNINPRTATFPICGECNNRLGGELEGPVSQIFPKLDAGGAISDLEAELLVRWLWKFEGFAAMFAHLDNPDWKYSDRMKFIDRILGPIDKIRSHLVLAIGLANKNDNGETDWPMGIDSGLSTLDGIFVSGVFKRAAIIVSLDSFANLIPANFGQYKLKQQLGVEPEFPFIPPVTFPYCFDAIYTTKLASVELKRVHEANAKAELSREQILGVRPRLIIPNR
jgi:hypothetical protein